MRSTLEEKIKTFTDQEGEIWVPIFRHYHISNMGRVASSMGRKLRLIKSYLTWRKYHIVHFRINGERKAYTIHRLVAMVFKNNIDPNRIEVNHLFSKNDNRAQSLEWTTAKENGKHAADNRLHAHGSAHYKTTLDEFQVRIIRSLRSQLKQREIANYFNISRGSVDAIMRRKSWIHA